MKINDIVNRAKALVSCLPASEASKTTLARYQKRFMAMLNEPGDLDCLRGGDSRDTYQFRRSALHATSRAMLTAMIDAVHAAGDAAVLDASNQHGSFVTLQAAASDLHKLLNRIEPAILLDPPCGRGKSSFTTKESRWGVLNGHIKRARNSKKNQLRYFGKDWQSRLWAVVPEDFDYQDVLAVHLLTPVRPEELVPGERPNGWAPGVIVELTAKGHLTLSWQPVKTHGGKYGSPNVLIAVDPAIAGDAARYLANKCALNGGRMIICVNSKNAVRKAFGRLGRKVFPRVKQAMTQYLFRHQFIADLKATFGAGGVVAAAAGQCVDDTQAHYGRRESGRKRLGIVRIYSARNPKLGSIARAHKLAVDRRHASKLHAIGREADTAEDTFTAIDCPSDEPILLSAYF
ncbi:hypothetical protein V1281_000234 [Nitrobacteraceae bacterium AZCC 2161]